MCKLSPLPSVRRSITGLPPSQALYKSSLDSFATKAGGEESAKPISVGASLKLPASLTGDFNWAPFHEIPAVPWRDWCLGVRRTATNTPWVQAEFHDLARDRRRSSKPVVQRNDIATTDSFRSPPRRQGCPDVVPSQCPTLLARCMSDRRGVLGAIWCQQLSGYRKSKVGDVERKEKNESPHA